MEAVTGLEAVGHSCISMLSSSVHLFLKSWVGRLENDHGMEFYINFKKNGWFNGYRKIFEYLEFDISKSGADININEQAVLSGNGIRLPDQLTIPRSIHTDSDMKKYTIPLFTNENEKVMVENDEDGDIQWWLSTSVASSKEKLFEAIEHVEKLCTWLESEYWRARNA